MKANKTPVLWLHLSEICCQPIGEMSPLCLSSRSAQDSCLDRFFHNSAGQTSSASNDGGVVHVYIDVCMSGVCW